jgi:hypothetical protein
MIAKGTRVLAAVLLLVAVSACASLKSGLKNDAEGTRKAPLTLHSAHATISSMGKQYIGVYEQGAPRSYGLVSEFASRIGKQPSLVLYYSAWYTPFQMQFAKTAYSHGATVIVQLQPGHISLQRIVDGQYDRFLRTYAGQVRAFGHPVVLSFGHEMNGTWYDWGAGHVPPSVFVAAWRHVVDVFRNAGAGNATWMWTINSLTVAAGSLSSWWPGSAWVDWVGIDGYYVHTRDTFKTIFGNTIDAVRQFTNKPVLISETGIGPGPAQVSQVQGLFDSVRSEGLLGIVWFDQTQHQGIYHQDWRLEDSPAALAEFRRESANMN